MNYLMTHRPIGNMSLIPLLLLAIGCEAYQPMRERSWIKFKDVPTPQYDKNRMVENYSILNATTIDIEERPSILANMVHRTIKDFQKHIKAYAETMRKRIKRANNANTD